MPDKYNQFIGRFVGIGKGDVFMTGPCVVVLQLGWYLANIDYIDQACIDTMPSIYCRCFGPVPGMVENIPSQSLPPLKEAP